MSYLRTAKANRKRAMDNRGPAINTELVHEEHDRRVHLDDDDNKTIVNTWVFTHRDGHRDEVIKRQTVTWWGEPVKNAIL